MNVKLRYICVALISIACSGCVTFFSDDPVCFDDRGETISCDEIQSLNISSNDGAMDRYSVPKAQDSSTFSNDVNFQVLSEYIEQMAISLKESSRGYNNYAPIAVTSFVHLDSTLKTTSILGNQIGEYFINELRNAGFNVSDHKVMGMIQVTPQGDIAMSRSIYDLRKDLKLGYVLTGTLVEDPRGVIVNARIVSMHHNQVIASTTKLLPNLIVNMVN